MFLSVIIPAYNEVTNITRVIGELEQNIAQCTDITRYEIIVVDDHSSDGTFNAVTSINRNNIRGLRLSRRSGSHTALRAGIKKAEGGMVLCISADGQDNPSVLSAMIAKIKAGDHTVWALRTSRNESYFSKLFSSVFYSILNWFTDQKSEINLANADFYLLDRRVVNAINSCEEKNTSLFGLIIWLGFRQSFVVYDRRERMSGRSKWNFKSRLRLAKDWIISFSGLPLKLITYVGMIASAFGFLYAIFLFFYTILGYSKPGWAETVLISLIAGGIIMIMLGIIGEYLWRTFDETRKRPLYFIEEEN
ncbi:MAG: glycosyltransferase family 2 protein [Bacteroidota bacterium]